MFYGILQKFLEGFSQKFFHGLLRILPHEFLQKFLQKSLEIFISISIFPCTPVEISRGTLLFNLPKAALEIPT